MQYNNPGTIKFKATIHGDPKDGGAWVYFPFDVQEKFGVTSRVPINATFDDVPYQGTMVKYGDPKHMILILKSIRAQIGKGIGDEVEVTVRLDDKPRIVEIPKDLSLEFKKNPKEEEYFKTLSYTHQREYVKHIEESKKPETRVRRIEKTIKMLKANQKIS